jgi:hypothetical protein
MVKAAALKLYQPCVSDEAVSHDTGKIRRTVAMELQKTFPSRLQGEEPRFLWVDPTELTVDESYQRNLSARSITLIRKIIKGWDWCRFKPPIVAPTNEGYEVIDGQHTAIAAASHPAINKIPVMVVQAADVTDRAAAFLGHNRDRLAITPMQMHLAALAAGDETAQTVDQVCRRAGVRLLKVLPSGGDLPLGETLAVSTIRDVVNRRGAMRARQALQVLKEAECIPISAAAIKAVESLLCDPEFADLSKPDTIISVVRKLGESVLRDAKLFADTHKVPYWKALAKVWFGHRRLDVTIRPYLIG